MRKIVTILSVLCLLIGVFFIGTASATGKIWFVPRNFTTIQEAWDSPLVSDGDTVLVGPGNFFGAVATLGVSKAVTIRARGCATINDGPAPWGSARPFVAGFFFPGNGAGSGTSIIGFKFKDVEFPVFSRGANDVTVKNNKMFKAIQAVTNWHGQGWDIIGNEVIDLQTSNGGGIGFLIGGNSQAWQGDIINNLILGNTVIGTLYVAADDGGGYNGSGIVLYADFRWGAQGPNSIAFNQIKKNKINMKSNNPTVVDMTALEMTDTRDLPDVRAITDNYMGYNSYGRTSIPIDLTPDNLSEFNTIEKNWKRGFGWGKWHYPHY
jgi:hypothetical protein